MIDAESTTLLLKEREMREIEQAKARGEAAPRFPWRPDQRTWAPSALYNAMIAPLTRFPLRGVIWYQGESNTDPARAPLYARVLQTLIQDWREAWAEGDFPFLFVQIANFETGPSAMWAEVRDAQRRSLTLMNTGMAVTIDIGEARNVHPTNKQEVGRRLALAARAIAYGEDLEYSGPLFRQAVQEGNSLRIWFDHVTSSLVAKGDMLKGFEVAGAQRQYVPADARIEGRTVIVSSPSVAVPVYVRYGWASNPECTLYNGNELPASPFTSER
jgi:sialate O-acetylesterase